MWGLHAGNLDYLRASILSICEPRLELCTLRPTGCLCNQSFPVSFETLRVIFGVSCGEWWHQMQATPEKAIACWASGNKLQAKAGFKANHDDKGGCGCRRCVPGKLASWERATRFGCGCKPASTQVWLSLKKRERVDTK